MDTNHLGENDLRTDYLAAKESLEACTFPPDENNNSSSGLNSSSMAARDLPTCKQFLWDLYERERLLLEVTAAIILAYLYPPLGAIYLFPEITAHWIAVIIIFFLSGFALRLNELSAAVSNVKFNIFVFLYNFLGISSVVVFVAKYFYRNRIVSEDLMKGMIICSCLSMPTNMMVVLAVASKGDEAAALFLATTMNLLGVFVTPLLIFFYLGEDSEIDFLNTYRTISLRVLLPVGVGMSMRHAVTGANNFAKEHKKILVTFRERCLVFVVYTTFCHTFDNESESTASQIAIMAVAQVILLISAMTISWILLFIFFNRRPRLRVVGVFACSTKTAALGIPFISAIYEDHPRLGIYTLPLLVWYLAQLVIGTLLSSRLARFVDYKERKYEVEGQNGQIQSKSCGILLEQSSWL